MNQGPFQREVTIEMSTNLELEQKIRELESTNRSLQADRDRIAREAEQEREGLRERLREAEFLEHTLQEQKMKLKDIIIKSGNSDSEPLDSVLIKSFSKLRERIQSIVHQDYTMKQPILEDSKSAIHDKQKIFFGAFRRGVPEPERRFRTRAKIYEILHTNILIKANFGLGDDMESGLANFERALRACKEGKFFTPEKLSNILTNKS